jgi:hypothetical protein
VRRVLLACLTVLGLAGLVACGGDDSAPATTAAAAPTTSTTVLTSTTAATTTAAPTTLPTTTTTAPDPAQAPPCNVGEVKVDREAKVFYEPGDPRYGTVPPAFVICLPDASVAQSEGFAPAPPG